MNTEGNIDTHQQEQEQLQARMKRIRRKILILSGKGGVGKSTVAANIALALARAGKQVGLLDIDVHGPSIPKMLGLEGHRVSAVEGGLLPVDLGDNLKIISIGFMLPEGDSPVIWRGPLKYNVIKQFLKDVVWGDLDYLVIDSPPGTGDEPLSIAQFLAPDALAVIVTTPQQVAVSDVRKSIQFCRKLQIRILGIVENMSGFICPHCGKTVDIFKTGGGRTMAREMNLPFLGSIPIDPNVVTSSDDGRFFLTQFEGSPAAQAFETVIRLVLEQDNAEKELFPMNNKHTDPVRHLKIAIPVIDGRLCMHFGHCQHFAMVTTTGTKPDTGLAVEYLPPPSHEPGALPRWLHEQGADVIIAGGMGSRAQELFRQSGIEVVVGASADTPENLVQMYLSNTLTSGQNVCDH
ncbi:P-loop NTPase [bacterium]|nr:P-loop NTPase [candidate division CSSED10-310 bacterium]